MSPSYLAFNLHLIELFFPNQQHWKKRLWRYQKQELLNADCTLHTVARTKLVCINGVTRYVAPSVPAGRQAALLQENSRHPTKIRSSTFMLWVGVIISVAVWEFKPVISAYLDLICITARAQETTLPHDFILGMNFQCGLFRIYQKRKGTPLMKHLMCQRTATHKSSV